MTGQGIPSSSITDSRLTELQDHQLNWIQFEGGICPLVGNRMPINVDIIINTFLPLKTYTVCRFSHYLHRPAKRKRDRLSRKRFLKPKMSRKPHFVRLFQQIAGLSTHCGSTCLNIHFTPDLETCCSLKVISSRKGYTRFIVRGTVKGSYLAH